MRTIRFTGNVRSMKEGEVVFGNEPLLNLNNFLNRPIKLKQPLIGQLEEKVSKPFMSLTTVGEIFNSKLN